MGRTGVTNRARICGYGTILLLSVGCAGEASKPDRRPPAPSASPGEGVAQTASASSEAGGVAPGTLAGVLQARLDLGVPGPEDSGSLARALEELGVEVVSVPKFSKIATNTKGYYCATIRYGWRADQPAIALAEAACDRIRQFDPRFSGTSIDSLCAYCDPSESRAYCFDVMAYAEWRDSRWTLTVVPQLAGDEMRYSDVRIALELPHGTSVDCGSDLGDRGVLDGTTLRGHGDLRVSDRFSFIVTFPSGVDVKEVVVPVEFEVTEGNKTPVTDTERPGQLPARRLVRLSVPFDKMGESK
jgi:hypothetical protein